MNETRSEPAPRPPADNPARAWAPSADQAQPAGSAAEKLHHVPSVRLHCEKRFSCPKMTAYAQEEITLPHPRRIRCLIALRQQIYQAHGLSSRSTPSRSDYAGTSVNTLSKNRAPSAGAKLSSRHGPTQTSGGCCVASGRKFSEFRFVLANSSFCRIGGIGKIMLESSSREQG